MSSSTVSVGDHAAVPDMSAYFPSYCHSVRHTAVPVGPSSLDAASSLPLIDHTLKSQVTSPTTI